MATARDVASPLSATALRDERPPGDRASRAPARGTFRGPVARPSAPDGRGQCHARQLLRRRPLSPRRDAAIAHGRALMARGRRHPGHRRRVDAAGRCDRCRSTRSSIAWSPVIEALAKDGALVSIDTRHAAVMRAAVAAGARIVNDVTALAGDPESLVVVAESGAAVVLMHMQGEPRTMQQDPHLPRRAARHLRFLRRRVSSPARPPASIAARIALDPGIGFGKHDPPQPRAARRSRALHGLGCALLLGVSRKSFIGRLSRGEDAESSLARLARGRSRRPRPRRADRPRPRCRRNRAGAGDLAGHRRLYRFLCCLIQ